MDEGRNDGQLLLISGFLIAIGLVTITLMLNNVIYTGNIAYAGTMDTANNDVFDIGDLTKKEVNNAYYNASEHGYDPTIFNSYMSNFASAAGKIYAYKGSSLKVDGYSCDPANKNYNCKISFIEGGNRYFVNDLNLPLAPAPGVVPPVDPSGTPTRIFVYSDSPNITANNIDKTRVWACLRNDAGVNVSKSGVTIIFTTTRGNLSATSAVTDANGKAFVELSGGTPAIGIASITATSPALMSGSTNVELKEVPPPPPGVDPLPGHNLQVTITAVKLANGNFSITGTVKNTGTTTLSLVTQSLFFNVSGASISPIPQSKVCPNNLSVGEEWTTTWELKPSKKNKNFKFYIKSDALCTVCRAPKETFVRWSTDAYITS